MKKIQTKKTKNLITKEMTISETASKYPETIQILMKYGMHCIGCPMAMSETLEQGLSAHGMDVDNIINQLNKIVKKKK